MSAERQNYDSKQGSLIFRSCEMTLTNNFSSVQFIFAVSVFSILSACSFNECSL